VSAVILDAGPLGVLSHPKNPPHVHTCRQWASALKRGGRRVIVPEISDYELRRELLRRASRRSLAILDALAVQFEYLALTTTALRLAADFWAQSRRGGYPTASDLELDADVIIAAQAATLGCAVIIATGNVGHLARFVPAELWQNIAP
jgi:predicted nucleic acid-binding protein